MKKTTTRGSRTYEFITMCVTNKKVQGDQIAAGGISSIS